LIVCKWFKKKYPKPEEAPGWLMGLDKCIEESEDAVGVHYYWADYVSEHPEWADAVGDEEWHFYWANVHASCAWWLRLFRSQLVPEAAKLALAVTVVAITAIAALIEDAEGEIIRPAEGGKLSHGL